MDNATDSYTKACTKCGEVKGAEGFHRDKSKRGGLDQRCKACAKAYRASLGSNPARLAAIANIDFTTYTKACKKCGEVKEAARFSKSKSRRDGLQPKCKACVKSHHDANKAEIAAKKAVYRAAHKEDIAAYRAANKAEIAAQQAAYVKANPEKYRARNAKRRAAKLQRTPDWLSEYDHKVMQSIYAIAKHASEIEGIDLHVDHIIPMQGEKVSGLHTPRNLCLLPAAKNKSKGNRFCTDSYHIKYHH